jgi:NADH-quinone oxidoreductase subunit L
VDELYLFITKKIIFNHISRPVAWFDRHIVDGTMNGISYVTNQASNRIRGFQSGQLQHYALAFISGAIVLALVFIYFWTN